MVAPQVVVRVYSIVWKRPELDLKELAKLRWVHKWSVKRLAAHFDRRPETIQGHLCRVRKSKKWRELNLSKEEEAIIKSNIEKALKGS